MDLKSILLKYWGYSSFRPLQEDIIMSVLEGHDTLALLPTGGGKSLCYQVPAIMQEGLCIVVSPLIALMKDQVQALRSKGIKAVGIYHGLGRAEIDNAVDNCVYGDVKFLYMSPERLSTDLVRSRLEKMNVNLLAVDEAHCISQWGYDFRPPYLRIAEARELIPNAPVLALTATATKSVTHDIQEKLRFRDPRVFRKSFERKNLAYMVIREEDKLSRLCRVSNKVRGTGIVYVRNRKRTREISDYLNKKGISSDFYHAGLDARERDKKQDSWMKERTRVIVATNAFGMGIDKPNVRFVVHMDLPDSPEAYFQEAGRAGRDGFKSFAILLVNQSDISDLENFHEKSFPPLKTIRQVYNCLGNYFQLAIGSGKDQSLPFDMVNFARTYSLDPFVVFNALGFLEKEGYIAMSEALANPSRMMFFVNNEELYRFQVANPNYDPFIKLILRSYTGLFSEFTKINEDEIASRAGVPVPLVRKMLTELHNMQILHYKEQNDSPVITFLQERMAAADLTISAQVYNERKKFSKERMKHMKEYATSGNKCRSLFLLSYFGEGNAQRCGQCDVCIGLNKTGVSSFEYKQVVDIIKPLIKSGNYTPEQLLEDADISIPEAKLINVIRYLKDIGVITEDKGRILRWNDQEEK